MPGASLNRRFPGEGNLRLLFNLNKGITSVGEESYETDISIAKNTFVTERNSESFRENSE